MGLGLRVEGLGCWVLGFGSRISVLGFGFRFMVECLRFYVQASGFRVLGFDSGFWIQD